MIGKCLNHHGIVYGIAGLLPIYDKGLPVLELPLISQVCSKEFHSAQLQFFQSLVGIYLLYHSSAMPKTCKPLIRLKLTVGIN